jgi:hypothetical protein
MLFSLNQSLWRCNLQAHGMLSADWGMSGRTEIDENFSFVVSTKAVEVFFIHY